MTKQKRIDTANAVINCAESFIRLIESLKGIKLNSIVTVTGKKRKLFIR